MPVPNQRPDGKKLDWGQLASLRLRAQQLAEGIYFGLHASPRRGAGVEFGGHRTYVPGDDLRWLDRHALMRHARLLVREFESETDRNLYIVLDTTRSMDFSSNEATATKLNYACLLVAALTRIAIQGGDRVALSFLSGQRAPLRPMGGREAFERVLQAFDNLSADNDLTETPEQVTMTLAQIGQSAPRGSIILLCSDLLDLPEDTPSQLATLGSRRRTPIAVQILDSQEANFPLEGPVRLKSLEGDVRVETDATVAKADYLERLALLSERYQQALLPRGGRHLRITTDEDPVVGIHRILSAIRGLGA